MSDWLDDFDVNEIPDDEFQLPRNTYLCKTVGYKSAAKQTKSGNEHLAYFIISWQIDEGEYSTYQKFGQWIALPPIKGVNEDSDVKEFDPTTRDNRTILTRFKKVVMSLGYGADEFKGILRQTLGNDFDWVDNRVAMITAASYKNDAGFTQVRIYDHAPYEGGNSGPDIDLINNKASSDSTEIPF